MEGEIRSETRELKISPFHFSFLLPPSFHCSIPVGNQSMDRETCQARYRSKLKDIYEHVSRMRKDRCVKPSRPRSRFLIWRASTGSWGRPANNRIINRNISQPRDHLPRLGILFESSETFQVKSVKEVITRGMRQFQHTFHPPKVFLSFPQIRREIFLVFDISKIFFSLPNFSFSFL